MNVIPNNIQAKEFRYRAECRDQLQHKGDLYVGTGITEEVALDDGTTKNMCKTEPLYRTTDGLAPASDDSNQPTNGMALVIDNSNSTGWKVGQVETAGIKDYAITEAKLSKEYYIKNKSIDFVSDRTTGDLPHIGWAKLSSIAGRHSTLILQVPLQSTERTTTILNLPVTNSVNILATKEQIERGEIVAKIAQYASEDTSKGTIEARLTSLGFKEGDFTLTNSDFYWTQSDQSEKNLGQTIKISREGNYCFLPGRLAVTTGTYRAYALFKATTGSVAANTTIGYVPAEFAPETSVSFRTYNHPNSASSNWYFFTLCGKDTDTPGELKTGLTTSFTAGTKYILAFVDTDDIQSSDSYRKGWYSKAGAILPNKKLIAPLNLSVEWRSAAGTYSVYLTLTNPNSIEVTANWDSHGEQERGSFTMPASSTTTNLLFTTETNQGENNLNADIYFSADGYTNSNISTFN